MNKKNSGSSLRPQTHSRLGVSLAAILFTSATFLASNVTAQRLSFPNSKKEKDIIELEEFKVEAQQKGLPGISFNIENPTFSYYKVPKLENGDIILALDFIDRYREIAVPGDRKWAGLINFPWVDSYGLKRNQWLCLYLWDDVIYGASPTAQYNSDRRFATGIKWEHRQDPEHLLAIAEKYVERVAPGGTNIEIYSDYGSGNYGWRDNEWGGYGWSDYGWGGYGWGSSFKDFHYIDYPPGEIAPVTSSQKGKSPRELVSLVYQFEEYPNTRPATSFAMGKAPRDPGEKFDWAAFFDLDTGGNPYEVARDLLKPRWSRKAEIQYRKDVLIFKDLKQKTKVLLFNVGEKIFAYSPRYGIWKTDATLPIIQAGMGSNLITYPGMEAAERVALLPWKAS